MYRIHELLKPQIEEGEKKAKIEMARQALTEGLSGEIIARLIGLTTDQINQLKKKN